MESQVQDPAHTRNWMRETVVAHLYEIALSKELFERGGRENGYLLRLREGKGKGK